MTSGQPCWLCAGRLGEGREGPGGAGLRLRICGGCGLIVGTGPWEVDQNEWALDPLVREGRLPLYGKLLDEMESRCAPGRLLDLGCAAGDFIALARARGWDARGVEPEAELAAAADEKGRDVFHGFLHEARFADDSFDVVTAWDVLDIARQPLDELREIFRLLKPGGFLFTRLRNGPAHIRLWSFGKRCGLEALTLLPVLHRHGFSARTLRGALAQAGFVDTRVANSGPTQGRGFVAAWTAAAELLSLVSGGAWLAALSLVAVCRKPHPRPRLLHLITRLDAGGSSENVILSARGAAERGFSVLVGAGPSARVSSEAARSPFPLLALSSLRREISPWTDLMAFWQIQGLLRRWAPDIVHTHSSKAGFLGRWAAWLVNHTRPGVSPMRIVHTPHGHVFYGYFGRLKSALFLQLERLSALITDQMVALSEGERQESLRYGMGRPEQWRVVPSGVALPSAPLDRNSARRRLFGELGVAPDALVVGSVARLEPVKGVDVLVRAAAAVLSSKSARPIIFLLVGDGQQRRELERLARELAIAKSVVFAGHRNDVPQLMTAMDIYAQPSRNEGMGKTLVLAQSLGLPVVASRVCGIPGTVDEGVSALLVPADDPASLAQAILKLARDPALRAAMGEAGRRWVGRQDDTGCPAFSVEAMVLRLERLYLEGQP